MADVTDAEGGLTAAQEARARLLATALGYDLPRAREVIAVEAGLPGAGCGLVAAPSEPSA